MPTRHALVKKIVIVSDIHANAESFQVLPDEYDELRILGDLANYGPNPVEVIDFARLQSFLGRSGQS